MVMFIKVEVRLRLLINHDCHSAVSLVECDYSVMSCADIHESFADKRLLDY